MRYDTALLLMTHSEVICGFVQRLAVVVLGFAQYILRRLYVRIAIRVSHCVDKAELSLKIVL